MIIPEKLKVEGHIFDVKWVDGKVLDDDESLTYADVDRAELTIRLRNNGVKKSVMEESFFHEIIHLCDSETHPMPHKLVDDIARRLYALLKENNLLNNN
jgi:Mn-dependent DtxR family transcriptional regulator